MNPRGDDAFGDCSSPRPENPGRKLVDCLAHLRTDPSASAPADATGDILARVHQRRAFVGANGRRKLSLGRVSLAIGLSVLAGSAAFAAWYGPDMVAMWRRPAPLTSVVTSASTDVSRTVQAVASLQLRGMSAIAPQDPSSRSNLAKPARTIRSRDDSGSGWQVWTPVVQLAGFVRANREAMINPLPIWPDEPVSGNRAIPPTQISSVELARASTMTPADADVDGPSDLADAVASAVAGRPLVSDTPR